MTFTRYPSLMNAMTPLSPGMNDIKRFNIIDNPGFSWQDCLNKINHRKV